MLIRLAIFLLTAAVWSFYALIFLSALFSIHYAIGAARHGSKNSKASRWLPYAKR